MPAEQSEAPGRGRGCVGPGDVDPSAVHEQLDRIVSSDMFSRSARLSRFLRYVVGDALENKGRGLKEYAIAREVFGKPEDFDTRLDPIVRVEAGRLRGRLTEYYAEQGNGDPIVIELGKRGYRPRFRFRNDGMEAPPAVAAAAAEKEIAIAVLPFVDLTEEANQQYFCDGLTEEVIHALTRVKSLQVVSRSSAFQFKGSGHDVRKVGSELGAAVVIEGSVRKTGKRLRVTVQLTSAETGFHLWSENYDSELDDLFEAQETISAAIVSTVREHGGGPLNGAPPRRQSVSTKAHRDFLQGLYFQNGTSLQDLSQSVLHLESAIAGDPEYPVAYATLAWSYAKIAWLALGPPRETWPKAIAAANKALELDESSAAAHAALGSAHAAGEWNWPLAQREFARALETGGDDSVVHQAYAVQYLVPGKRLDEALAEVLLAVERSPNSLEAWSNLGWVHFCRGEYQEAADRLKNVLAGQPDYAPALSLLARTFGQMGTLDKAVSTLQIAADVSGRDPSVVALLGFYYAQLGQAERAAEVRQELESRVDAYVPPLAFAHLEIGLGRRSEAIERLRQAVDDRSARLVDLDADPIYDALRSSEEFGRIRAAICLT